MICDDVVKRDFVKSQQGKVTALLFVLSKIMTNIASTKTIIFFNRFLSSMINTKEISEAELIRELKLGSKDAFDKIYTLYSKRLYGYCLKISKSREDAEEIVQDVFLRLWNMKADIRQEETLRSLLFIISKNYLIKSSYNRINSQIFEDYVNYEEKLRNNDRSDSNIEYEDFLKTVRFAMQKLPETQRKVIELSRLQQYSVREVAVQLSLSEQTIRNQLSLGLKTLKQLLGGLPALLLLLVKFLSD